MATEPQSAPVTNRSNAVLTTAQIMQNLRLLEDPGNLWWFWHPEVAPTMAGDDLDYLKNNFPRGNPLRAVILERAFTIPTPKIGVSDAYGDDPTAEKPEPVEGEEPAENPKRKELAVALAELLARRIWEGEKTVGQALPWWRVFLLATADNFFKLPKATEEDVKQAGFGKAGECWPERMQSQWCALLPHPTRQKMLAGYTFQYPAGGQFNNAGVSTDWTIETITRTKWVRQLPSGVIETRELKLDFIPAVHWSWEERQGNPRGLPLIDRLKQKLLDLLTAAYVRKGGVKRSGAGIQVVKNAGGITEPVKPGGLVNLADSANKTSDFQVVGMEYDDGPAQRDFLDQMDLLYDEAALPSRRRSMESGSDPASGEAISQMGKKEQRYVQNFVDVEGPFLADMLAKTLTIEGHPCTAKDICVEYDLSAGMTPSQKLETARLYFDRGYDEQALLILGHEPESLDEIMAARSTRSMNEFMGPNGGNISAEAQAEIDKLLGKKTGAEAE